MKQTTRTHSNNDSKQLARGDYATLPTGTTHYKLEGPADGKLVVLIHGFSVPLYIWDKNVEAFHQAGYRTLRYDLFGRGGSESISGAYNLELYRNQLTELLAYLNFSKTQINVVAICMGAIIATDFILTNYDKIQSLIMIGPAGLPGTVPPEAHWIKAPFLGDFLMNMCSDQQMIKALDKHLLYLDHFPEYKEKYRQQVKSFGFKQALLSTIRNMPLDTMSDSYQKLSNYLFPKLLLWGENDLITPPEQADLMLELVPDANAWLIPYSGHVCNYEQSEAVNKLMCDFLLSVK